jgi:ClpP class serine protease
VLRFDWFGILLLLILVGAALWPVAQGRLLQLRRTGSLERFARARSSRAVTLIARRETFRFFGLPLLRRDELDAPEAVLRQIARTPALTPIDLILHAGAGQRLAAEQLAHALIRHPARVTVFIPHYAIGEALLIALAADELVLDPNAVLGPLMPYAGPYPAVSVLTAVRDKGPAQVDDHTLILADQARKARAQVQTLIAELLTARNPEMENIPDLAAQLSGDGWTPHYPILVEEARRLGLRVSDEFPPELYALLDLYDTASARRPTCSVAPIDLADRP